MSIELFDLGAQVAAVATIVIGFGLVALGRATGLGYAFRTTIEPAMIRFRRTSELSRSELAGISTLVACGLAVLDLLINGRVLAGGLAILLWLSRPAVAKLTTEEHPLLAMTNSFAIDLMIGMYVPITISQLLLRHVLMAGSFLAVVVALSWPAGGGATQRRFRFVGVS